jgi:predicted methyltransferase
MTIRTGALVAAVVFSPALPALPAQLAAQSARPAQSAPKKPRLFPPQDLGLLEAPDRDDWNKPEQIMDALGIADGAVVADLGAGGGWMEIRLVRRVGPNGVVYAEDIQPQMIEAINRRMQHEGLSNVRTVMGTATDPRLPAGLDAVLIVNGYREMDDPLNPEQILTFLKNVARSLKPQGRLGVADFLPGGGGPGPAAEDRVNPDTVIRAAENAGFKLQTREVVPPFQFVLVFKLPAAGR